jgi:hypothetical protein
VAIRRHKPRHLGAVDPGHLPVHENCAKRRTGRRVGPALPEHLPHRFHPLCPATGAPHLEAVALQEPLRHGCDGCLVVNHEHGQAEGCRGLFLPPL